MLSRRLSISTDCVFAVTSDFTSSTTECKSPHNVDVKLQDESRLTGELDCDDVTQVVHYIHSLCVTDSCVLCSLVLNVLCDIEVSSTFSRSLLVVEERLRSSGLPTGRASDHKNSEPVAPRGITYCPSTPDPSCLPVWGYGGMCMHMFGTHGEGKSIGSRLTQIHRRDGC